MIEVKSEDGTKRRWVRVQENGYTQTLSGPAPIRPTYWFADTGGPAHTKDGRKFTDPHDNTKYKLVEE